MFKNGLTADLSEEYIGKVSELRAEYCPMNNVIIEAAQDIRDLATELSEGMVFLENGEYSFQSALQAIYDTIEGGEGISAQQVFAYFTSSIEYFSTSLSVELPEMFIPYYYKYNFNVLEKIAQTFNIKLPSLPLKSDYLGRFFYYGEVCAAFGKFRTEYNLSPYELCAFLYDFAPKSIGGMSSYIMDELPEPQGSFFIGSSQDDKFLKEEAIAIAWQCNPETRAGDRIVMYLTSPISAVDSVWSSVSVGFNDPFFYYYRCTYIARRKKLNQIPLKQLRADHKLNELPIVRRNMQGINGVELLPSDYNRILDLAGSDLPRFKYQSDLIDTTFTRERDVEDKRVKPLLEKLGYSETHYKQQVYIRVGNKNHLLIPDFVVRPVTVSGHMTADFLIEAKLSVSSITLLEQALSQARSYAKLLSAKFAVIVSKEGIWIMDARSDFNSDIMSYTWNLIESDPDSFREVYKLIGNGAKRT